MGNWNINIQGVGCHHNVAVPNDANRMAERFVRDLRNAGHTIEHASFTHGEKDDLLAERPVGPKAPTEVARIECMARTYQALTCIINQLSENADPEVRRLYGIAACLPGALGLVRLWVSDELRLDEETFFNMRSNIHRVLGAPGDWGYGTPLGDALAALYQCK